MNPSKYLDCEYIVAPNYLPLQGNSWETKQFKNYYKPLVRKTKFNDPSLPKHVNEKTIFGIKTKTKSNIADVIFPNKLFGEKFVELENETKLHKNSYFACEIGKPVNRRYTTHFDPNRRYGVENKSLPVGFWFKNNVEYQSLNENKNYITNYISKLVESEENKNSHDRYLYNNNYQGKFRKPPYLRIKDILTRNYTDKKEDEFISYVSEVNKIKYLVRKRKFNLKELRETYYLFDKEYTGWLPLDQVYKICHRYKLKPDSQLFDLALNSIQAIKEDAVRYDLFVDLLDPNIQFAPIFEKNIETKHDQFVTTYRTHYENIFSQNVQTNKKDNASIPFVYCVKPPVDYSNSLGLETTARTLLNPSIFTNYGLTHRDFYVGRSKDVMKKLFRDVGVILSDDVFNDVWDNAYRREGSDYKVSVEVFKQVLQELTSIKF